MSLENATGINKSAENSDSPISNPTLVFIVGTIIEDNLLIEPPSDDNSQLVYQMVI